MATKKKTKQKKKEKKAKKTGQTEKREVKKVERKEELHAENEKKVVYARAKYIKGSAQKARLVIDLIRGKGAVKSLHKLNFVNKRAALPIKKALKSAVANAINNFEMDRKRLKIVEAQVDEAPTFKRGRAGSRGRYKKILKRNCHIRIGVTEE